MKKFITMTAIAVFLLVLAMQQDAKDYFPNWEKTPRETEKFNTITTRVLTDEETRNLIAEKKLPTIGTCKAVIMDGTEPQLAKLPEDKCDGFVKGGDNVEVEKFERFVWERRSYRLLYVQTDYQIIRIIRQSQSSLSQTG